MENKAGKYFKYALGEIILVVIGILIALQINNWNENRKLRQTEIGYLINLKSDLIKERENNTKYRLHRLEQAKNASFLINLESQPETIEDALDFTIKFDQVTFWVAYVRSNNTFKELISSGNLSLISNDSIKNSLFEIDEAFSQGEILENHMRREYEHYLYDEELKNISFGNFYDFTEPTNIFKRKEIIDIPDTLHKQVINDVAYIYNNQTINNGLKLAMSNNNILARGHEKIGEQIETLIKLIDKDIEK